MHPRRYELTVTQGSGNIQPVFVIAAGKDSVNTVTADTNNGRQALGGIDGEGHGGKQSSNVQRDRRQGQSTLRGFAHESTTA